MKTKTRKREAQDRRQLLENLSGVELVGLYALLGEADLVSNKRYDLILSPLSKKLVKRVVDRLNRCQSRTIFGFLCRQQSGEWSYDDDARDRLFANLLSVKSVLKKKEEEATKRPKPRNLILHHSQVSGMFSLSKHAWDQFHDRYHQGFASGSLTTEQLTAQLKESFARSKRVELAREYRDARYFLDDIFNFLFVVSDCCNLIITVIDPTNPNKYRSV